MITELAHGRKKTGGAKRAEEDRRTRQIGDKYYLWGSRRNGLSTNFTLTVYIQFLVAADSPRDARGTCPSMPRTDTPSPTQRRVDLWPGKVWTARRRASGATTTGAAGAKSMGSGGTIENWIRKEGVGETGKGHGNLREKGGGGTLPKRQAECPGTEGSNNYRRSPQSFPQHPWETAARPVGTK